jgi:hypothetical protein
MIERLSLRISFATTSKTDVAHGSIANMFMPILTNRRFSLKRDIFVKRYECVIEGRYSIVTYVLTIFVLNVRVAPIANCDM